MNHSVPAWIERLRGVPAELGEGTVWSLENSWNWPAWVTLLFVIVAVGVGRVALNVHHPSDVLAGWALGYAYVVLCLAVVHPRGERPAEPDTAQ